jgi:hypothetical protein
MRFASLANLCRSTELQKLSSQYRKPKSIKQMYEFMGSEIPVIFLRAQHEQSCRVLYSKEISANFNLFQCFEKQIICVLLFEHFCVLALASGSFLSPSARFCVLALVPGGVLIYIVFCYILFLDLILSKDVFIINIICF